MLKAAIGLLLTLFSAACMAKSAHLLYGPQGVSPGAVKQGVLGSCYFHASIAAIAMTKPETLRNDIRHNFPVGYKVHFASGPGEAVYPDDIKYGRAHGFDDSDGDWVLVLMRAYAQREVRESLVDSIQRSRTIPAIAKPLALKWLNETDLMLVAYDRAIRAVVQQNGSMDQELLKSNLAGELLKIRVPGSEMRMLVGFLDEKGFFAAIAETVQKNGEVFGAYKSIGQGGIAERVIGAFMGSAGAADVSNRQVMLNEFRRVRGGGAAVVASTVGSINRENVVGTNWFVASHAYTVMNYDENAGVVTLRNPWGTRPGPDGIFSLPFGEFEESFDYISYSQR